MDIILADFESIFLFQFCNKSISVYSVCHYPVKGSLEEDINVSVSRALSTRSGSTLGTSMDKPWKKNTGRKWQVTKHTGIKSLLH